MHVESAEQLLSRLSNDSNMVQLHYRELESLIAWCMDEVYRLAKSGEDDDLKMRLVALEYKARLLIERFRKAAVN